jgi:hypothetical protein
MAPLINSCARRNAKDECRARKRFLAENLWRGARGRYAERYGMRIVMKVNFIKLPFWHTNIS